MNEENEFENDDVETDLGDEVHYQASASSESVDDEAAILRENLRKQLQSDVEAFLASGGRINEIPPNVVADPPKKPQSNYGGQPI